MLLSVFDEGLSDGVFDSIFMVMLLVVDKVRFLGFNFLKFMGKNRSWKMNYLVIYFFYCCKEIIFENDCDKNKKIRISSFKLLKF